MTEIDPKVLIFPMDYDHMINMISKIILEVYESQSSALTA